MINLFLKNTSTSLLSDFHHVYFMTLAARTLQQKRLLSHAGAGAKTGRAGCQSMASHPKSLNIIGLQTES
jgi:hypothetical protein